LPKDATRNLRISSASEAVAGRSVDSEQEVNYVPVPFPKRSVEREAKRGHVMVRSVVEEALALAAISLFLATVAVWAQVLGVV
jgi:hypothetical protein